MIEIELKFQVPAAARDAVAKAMASGRSERTRLQAVYYDTPDRRLAAASAAVRLRLEGSRWVQTAKAGDPHGMQRHEHNAPVDGAADGPPPALDLARHQGTPVGDLIARALGGAAPGPLFRTDVHRTHREVRAGKGTLELALDIGEITGGDRHWPLHELEIELVDGDPLAVLDAASCWVARHGLWLDVRSKAERGDRVSRGVDTGEPVLASPWPAHPSLREVARLGLAHLLPNASEVASGTFTPGHLLQVNEALLRLVGTLPSFPEADPAWTTTLTSTLAAASDAATAVDALRQPAFTQVLLALQAVALVPEGQPVTINCTMDPSTFS